MIPALRQQKILQHLAAHDIASVAELTRLLDVSHMTVRRDIQRLEGQGKVVSVSGGVALAMRITDEPSHLDKRTMRQAQKENIAREAEQLVAGGATIYLDAGTTTLALARRMAAAKRSYDDLFVATNDLVIANYLAETLACRLYFIGGPVDVKNRSCVGDGAARAIKNLNIDVAFLSTPSWNSRWLTIPDGDKALVKRAIVASATRSVLLCDSSKYGRVGAFKAVKMSAFDTVITDAELAEAARESLEGQGVRVVSAK